MIDLLLNERLVQWSLIFFVFVTPSVALVLRFGASVFGGTKVSMAIFWAIFSAGPLIGLFWLIYNSIISYFGLDSIVGLALCAALSIILGTALGLAWRRWA